MIDQLARDIESSKKNEQVMLQGILQDIKKTLQKLLALDPMFGSHKRKSAMYLSNKVHQAFNDVEQNSIPQINRMIEIVDKLERDVSVCIDRAKSLIFSCKKCKTAESLAKCIDENTKYATKILDKASHNAQNSLNEMESLKRETLDYHKATLHCISRRCRKDSEKLLTHLNNCVLSVKNGKKGGSR
ncbi:uncharacterized protein LOC116414810 [Apis florea]|uniref:uncharacterized protein LOC116414810 n=1 Tax=Apis florea TaxID=7463 RepID=UPI0012FF5419|nr:uncharacterized protein LOC116414810 [Apis florea]